MQVKTTQVGGTGQAATVIDSEALGLQITQLESLYNTWLDTSEAAPDVGACGGSTIIAIEEMGNMFQRMQDSFMLLLNNTLSYMKGRKSSIDTKENNAAQKAGGSRSLKAMRMMPQLHPHGER